MYSRHSDRARTRGFSLVELLAVVLIIGILATVILFSVSKARQNGRNARRRSDLKQLQLAVISYWDANSSFPSTGGAWYSSSSADQASNNGGDWIPGLVAGGFIDKLPTDPQGGASNNPACTAAGWKRSYLYRSDGKNYKILSHCAPEGTWTSTEPFYDVVRPTHAWMVCGGVTACATW